MSCKIEKSSSWYDTYKIIDWTNLLFLSHIQWYMAHLLNEIGAWAGLLNRCWSNLQSYDVYFVRLFLIMMIWSWVGLLNQIWWFDLFLLFAWWIGIVLANLLLRQMVEDWLQWIIIFHLSISDIFFISFDVELLCEFTNSLVYDLYICMVYLFFVMIRMVVTIYCNYKDHMHMKY